MGEGHLHMGHTHAHQAPDFSHLHKAFVIGIILNFLFIIVEVVAGLRIHSLSLLSDAGHNLADVGSLALSLLAFRLLKVRSNKKYTYGYRKTTVLTALLNSVVLLVSIGAIIYEAFDHLVHPQPLPGKTIAIVAAIGIIINFVSALFFLKDKEKDLNVKAAYLHLLSDAVISLVLVIGGIIISFTAWYWIDPVLSIIVATTILISTWKLLRDSLRLSMDGVPRGIDLEKIKKEALSVDGIRDIYHIHVWAISTTENAMTAHIILKSEVDKKKESDIKAELRHLMEHLNIQHVTIETESSQSQPADLSCSVTTI